MWNFSSKTKSNYRKRQPPRSGGRRQQDVLRGAAVAASEARMVHVRPGRLPSTETDLALCIDRPRAEDPSRSGRSELSGSGPAPGGQERDRLEFQLSLSLHDGSWPSVGPTGPSKDPESRGAMGGGSFCFPLMAPATARVTPDMGQLTILNASLREKKP